MLAMCIWLWHIISIVPMLLSKVKRRKADDFSLVKLFYYLGHHEYFEKMSKEEREHAEEFMEYQNKRGGTIVLLDIKVCFLLYFNIYIYKIS